MNPLDALPGLVVRHVSAARGYAVLSSDYPTGSKRRTWVNFCFLYHPGAGSWSEQYFTCKPEEFEPMSRDEFEALPPILRDHLANTQIAVIENMSRDLVAFAGWDDASQYVGSTALITHALANIPRFFPSTGASIPPEVLL